MSLLSNSEEVIVLCQDPATMNNVIIEILNNRSLNIHIGGLLRKYSDPIIDKDSIMNDTIISFIKFCNKKDARIQSSVVSYLKRIATNIWLLHIRKHKKENHLELDSSLKSIEIINIIDKDAKKSISQLLNQIKSDCKEILELWALNYRMSEIASKLKYDSEGYLRKKKYLCLKKLISLVNSNQDLKSELLQYV